MLHGLDLAAHVDPQTGVLATVIPVSVYLLTLWAIRDRFCLSGAAQWILPAVAVLVLLIASTASLALEITTLILIATVLIRRGLTRSTMKDTT